MIPREAKKEFRRFVKNGQASQEMLDRLFSEIENAEKSFDRILNVSYPEFAQDNEEQAKRFMSLGLGRPAESGLKEGGLSVRWVRMNLRVDFIVNPNEPPIWRFIDYCNHKPRFWSSTAEQPVPEEIKAVLRSFGLKKKKVADEKPLKLAKEGSSRV